MVHVDTKHNKRYENGSVDGDRFHCDCAFLYLPGLVWTGPHSHSLSELPVAAVAECALRGMPTNEPLLARSTTKSGCCLCMWKSFRSVFFSFVFSIFF